ncbi:MAG: J domain-containing protein [Acidimicrobiales bacterium]
MTRDEAARLLGVGPTAGPDEVRTAFRRRLFRHHPDVAGAAGTAPTHQLIAAYRLLQSTSVSSPAVIARETRHRTGTAGAERVEPVERAERVEVAVDGDTLHVHLAPAAVFAALMEVGHGLGEVTYVDRWVGLLETIVVFDDYPVCSVVCDVQGRNVGSTDVVVMVESLTGDPAPTDAAVADLVADRLRALLTPR